MKLYIGTYKKYNEGSLFGDWLDLENYSNKDEFLEACRELHKDEDDPELMFQDKEDIPDTLYSESYIDAKIWEVLELEDYEQEAVLAYWSSEDGEIQDILDRYITTCNSFEEYAAEIADECFELPESIQPYFDYKAFARDLEHDYEVIEHENQVYIFSH